MPGLHEAIIETLRCGASICGRMPTSDALILSGFTADGNGWSDGRLYKADHGKTCRGRITVVEPNQSKVRGCVFVPLCKTQTWTRVRWARRRSWPIRAGQESVVVIA